MYHCGKGIAMGICETQDSTAEKENNQLRIGYEGKGRELSISGEKAEEDRNASLTLSTIHLFSTFTKHSSLNNIAFPL
jgi:hypothetical protein